MQRIECVLTVYFDEPFWVGVYERIENGKLKVCKITFGAEPKDHAVYAFFLDNWNRLRFSPPATAHAKSMVKVNPKRMQRVINKRLASKGVGTKSQQALKKQHEEAKLKHRKETRQHNKAQSRLQFELNQKKRKEKRKGH
ncbi:MAG: YjdF family protein [Eubacteriales bacterium]